MFRKSYNVTNDFKCVMVSVSSGHDSSWLLIDSSVWRVELSPCPYILWLGANPLKNSRPSGHNSNSSVHGEYSQNMSFVDWAIIMKSSLNRYLLTSCQVPSNTLPRWAISMPNSLTVILSHGIVFKIGNSAPSTSKLK